MVNPSGGARPSRFLFEGLRRQPETTESHSKQKSFQTQLQRSLASAASPRSVREETAPSETGVSKRQAIANSGRTRQEVVSAPAQKELAGPFGGTGAAIPAPKAAASSSVLETRSASIAAAQTNDPLAVLRNAMQTAGIPSNVSLTISDEIVQFPGGAYRNHLIKADFGNGVTENYSVDLMMKNPWLTAFEMKRLMNGAA